MAARRKKVLVVEDDEDTRLAISELVDLLGHAVVTAASAEDAIPAFDSLQPQVVFMDIGLPGMGGHALARQLRILAGERDVKLIVLSGWSQPEVVSASYASGIDLHITKPVGYQVLCHIVGDATDSGADPGWAEGSNSWQPEERTANQRR